MVDKGKVGLIVAMVVACVVAILAGPSKAFFSQRSGERRFYEMLMNLGTAAGMFDPWPSNPFTDKPLETYVWIPRDNYRITEKIPLYIERWYSPYKAGVAPSPYRGGFVPPPLEWVPEVKDARLLIRKAPFDKRIKVLLRSSHSIPRHPPEAYFPEPKTVPPHWLHGRPVKYKELDGDFAWVDLYPGESFVRFVPNLLDYWYLRKGPDGRMYVKCAVPAPKTYSGYKEIWLPVEGRYRLQFNFSNIMEFEIRQ